jgi:hypothetical protein
MSNLGASTALLQALASYVISLTACFDLQALQLIMLPYHFCNPRFALIVSHGPTIHDISLHLPW